MAISSINQYNYYDGWADVDVLVLKRSMRLNVMDLKGLKFQAHISSNFGQFDSLVLPHGSENPGKGASWKASEKNLVFSLFYHCIIQR